MSTPASDILAVALTRYADACPPTLHTDCPYAIATADGRSCEQQCRSEVIRLQLPGHQPVGSFPGPLFDARQVLLTESGVVPDAGWQTASLIIRLDETLGVPPLGRDGSPSLQREIEITNALAYLWQRDIDPDWLVRFGSGPFLPLRICVWIGDHYLNREEGAEDPTRGWLAIADSFLDEGTSFEDLGPWLAAAHSSGLRDHVEKWIKQAPLSDIWEWNPSPIDPDLVIADDGKAGWISDRFTLTYLSKWATPSLHHEFRYQRGLIEPPIPTSEMKRREVPITTLTAEIADRAVKTSGSPSTEVFWQALQFLAEGRRREAAALFDATRIIEPSDVAAHNNYGFCLTPDSPTEALHALRKAAALDDSVEPVNRINQAVALRLLGKTEDALAAAGMALENASEFGDIAWLWMNPENPETAEVVEVDPRAYLIRLGQALAEDSGDAEHIERWLSLSFDG